MGAPLAAALSLLPLVAGQEPPPQRELPPSLRGLPPPAPSPWEISGSLFYSDPPGSEDRLTAIAYADKGALHLEARWNYEDLDTLGLFAGWTFERAGDVEASATPMLGATVGDTRGIVPALEFDVAWRRVEWYAETEYLFDLDDRDDDFFYSWSTLTYAFTDGFAAGVVTERSKLVDTDFSLQRGLALELRTESAGLALYAFNLGSDDSYAVIALEVAP